MVATAAQAAEIKLMCSGAMRPALEELAPQFERASGHKLAITYGSTNTIRERALAGDAGYVTLVASAHRAKLVLDYLRLEGMPEEKLNRVWAPAGLDLGAATPEEIAAVMAALEAPLVLPAALAVSAVAGTVAGVAYWRRELGRESR